MTAAMPPPPPGALEGRPPRPVEELDVEDVEEALPFSRQLSPKCRLVDCANPSPTCADAPENNRLEFGEFRRRLELLAAEFFLERDLHGMIASITELGCQAFHDELAATLLRAALDRGETERQAVVSLLSALEAEGQLSNAQLVRGFEKLVLGWDDIQLDVPDAPGLLVAFLSSKVGLLHRSLFARLPSELLRSLCVGMPQGRPRSMLEAHLADLVAFREELESHLRQDLFRQRDADAFAAWLQSAGKPAYHHEVVAGACVMACQATPPEGAYWAACLDSEGLAAEQRSLALHMLAQLHSSQEGWLLEEADVQIGFSRLLGRAALLEKEHPRALERLVALLGGAVERELLPAEFLKSARRLRFGGAKGLEAVRAAQRKTPMYSRRAWGSGDARQFRYEEREAILEYFDSRNLEELAQIVQELHLSEAQQAHFVEKLLVLGMERDDTAVSLDVTAGLLGCCWSSDEVQMAFDQLRDNAKDLVLDMPDCRERTTELVRAAAGRGLLDDSYLALDGTRVV